MHHFDARREKRVKERTLGGFDADTEENLMLTSGAQISVLDRWGGGVEAVSQEYGTEDGNREEMETAGAEKRCGGANRDAEVRVWGAVEVAFI
ncbi:hypothetical protein PAAG_11945 [Paracoccidioides lutzii Pb01]|uniref:Uncharacterized protein n=1 Tax=Paracoccidioides lutzii (strain ATCC MYA-826 / Pb01) TaxID=502779 RepID=A0A0A2V4S7_PARBA|nr:hypothetical protein PAAG_11945 [Paracoccidioides lutzii Pb01]KGQ01367.1 hypothetical protein PAAG_11945 [Paracoccidioides lutzii Pb01]